MVKRLAGVGGFATGDTQMAKIIGAAMGIPNLTYIQLPAEQVIQALTQMGFSKNMATLMCEMSDALDSGRMRALEPRSAANTTPTRFKGAPTAGGT